MASDHAYADNCNDMQRPINIKQEKIEIVTISDKGYTGSYNTDDNVYHNIEDENHSKTSFDQLSSEAHSFPLLLWDKRSAGEDSSLSYMEVESDTRQENTEIERRLVFFAEFSDNCREFEEPSLSSFVDRKSETKPDRNVCKLLPRTEDGYSESCDTFMKCENIAVETVCESPNAFESSCQYVPRNKETKRQAITHKTQKAYNCGTCGHEFTLRSSLQRHIKTHTGEKPYRCEICGYKTALSSSLKRHNRTHSGEKHFQCEICAYQCTQSNALKEHTRIHTGEKPFKCELCGYRSTQRSSMKGHMMIHTGEKRFQCETCGYQCARSSSLKDHKMTHTSEKPFECKMCDYKCTYKRNMKSHIRTHTGEKPFKCEICEYKCTHSSAFKQHIKNHAHKNINVLKTIK